MTLPVVVEHVLSDDQYAELHREISGNQFGWYFLSDHNYGVATHDDVTLFGFRHLLINNNQSNSAFSHLVLPIVFVIGDTVGRQILEIVSVHANLTINVGRQHDGHPHTDCTPILDDDESELITAIYYIDTCDGDTLFFDDDETTVAYRQTPAANTMVVFPRSTVHSATLPLISQKRRIINFNVRVRRACAVDG
jgi:hypothetical protein